MASEEKWKRQASYLAMFFVALFWGLSWPVGRSIATNELGPVPFTSALLRFLIALPFLYFTVRIIERPKTMRLKRELWFPVAGLGILQVSLHNFLLLSSLRFTSGSDGVTILNGVITALTVILAPLFYRDENLSIKKLVGTALAIAGVSIIFIASPDQPVTNPLLGNFIIILTGLNWALYTIFAKRYLQQIKPLMFQFWAVVFGIIFLVVAAGFEQSVNPTEFITPLTWFNLGYMGIFAAALAYSFYNLSLRYIGASRTSIFINLSPFFGILFSVLLLNENFSIWYIIAFLVILSGIFVVESGATD